MKTKLLILTAAVLVIVLATGFSPILQAATKFRSIIVQDSITAGGALSVTGASTLTGAATFASNITQSDGNITTADFSVISPQTAISVTAAAVITPVGSNQPLESAGAVTGTLSSGCTTGRVVRFVNTVNQTITISETATAAIAGNFGMGQYDALTVICDGTRWVELGRSNN